MVAWRSARVRSVLVTVCATLAVLLAVGFLIILSGVYNVSARREHFDLTRWLIELTLHRSAVLHSLPVSAPALDDADLVRLGAGHYHTGCAPCHGQPGRAASPIVAQMLPEPPDLRVSVTEWTNAQLFWIVKHGLKFTGMPAWPAPNRDDEVWAVVAFLRKLPELTVVEYRALAVGNGVRAAQVEGALTVLGGGSDVAAGCVRCHGDERAPPSSALVPRLNGQSQTYLLRSLKSYADGSRASGIMQPLASALDPAEVEALTRHYAALAAPPGGSAAARALDVARGREIAEVGIASAGVPACHACHGAEAAAPFPRLDGQSAAYVAGQLRLWRQGARDGTPFDAIMAVIARRLNDRQIDAVAGYFAALPPPDGLPARMSP